MLDLHRIHIFTTVAEVGSFSAAAERLLLTQAAVSQHMSELEARLGVRLFVRERRGVTLTKAGQTLHGYALRLLTLAAEAESALAQHSAALEGQLAIGTTPGAGTYLLPEVIQAFRTDYPQITVQLQTGVTRTLLADLRARKLALALIEGELESEEADRFAITPLLNIEQCIVIGKNHPWWECAAIELSDLADQAFIMRPANSHTRIWLDRALANYGIRVRVSAEFDNVESIKRAVAAGSCVAVLPQVVVAQEEALGMLRPLQIKGRPLLRTLKLVRDLSVSQTVAATVFSDQLLQAFERNETANSTS
jgi:DNA-binding transcriptional LysR family regulator